MSKKSIKALEASLGLTPLKVDKGQGVIYGVKIIGFDSDNKRTYLPEALKTAIRLYEGVKVNIDHPEKNPTDARSAYDRFGKLVNVRYIEGKGLFGDLVYLKSHPMAQRVVEAAERMPEAFGLSHNAQGEGDTEGDTFVVSRITEVRHVDLVADPATTKSLSEAVMRKKLREEEKKPMENYDTPSDTKEEEDKKDDLASKVMDALKEADMSDEEKAQKIVDLVKEAIDDGAMNEDDTAADDGSKSDVVKEEEDKTVGEEDEEKKTEEEEDKPEDTKESKNFAKNSQLSQLQEEVRRIKKEAWVRRFCESIQLTVTKQLLGDFMGMDKSAIERIGKKLAWAEKTSKPKSGVPVTEGVSKKIPSGSDLYNWLKN